MSHTRQTVIHNVSQMMKKIFVATLAVFLIGCAEVNPIDRLVARLSSDPMWLRGRSPIITTLPASASPAEVASKLLYVFVFDDGKVTQHRILKVREVQIGHGRYTAVLVKTNRGEKIVLVQYLDGDVVKGWWGRAFDAKQSAENMERIQ